ncbi:MAG: hypothetical protein KDA63_00895 [Planctomycetales bacterium]|nr:hypothetical protein [Planctomycetales bacterium]
MGGTTGYLEALLLACCFVQVTVAVVNLNLVRILDWRADVERMSPLVREVFHIHAFFVSLTLLLFAVLTWRFANVMATGGEPTAAWLAGAMGLFWGIRTLMQWFYYSPSHWRGQTGRTVIHWMLTVVYGAMTITYLIAASR